MNVIGIIPARFASTRFPGKPLIDIMGKPMIQHVYEQSEKAFQNVYVATDDEQIEQKVIRFGGKVVMTSTEHQSGTDRLAEALEKIESIEKKQYDIVVNIQGDEPFISPDQLSLLLHAFNDPQAQIATLIRKARFHEEILNPNIPKVVLDTNKRAIYFSRSPIPYLRNCEESEWVKKFDYFLHIGLYAYKSDVLRKITKLPQSLLEKAESLEQLRWLENNYVIKTMLTDKENIAVDTPDDLEVIKKRFDIKE